MQPQIGVNEKGLRIGQYHPRAKLSDDEIALIFEMLEEADNAKLAGLPYLKDYEIAAKFEIGKSALSHIRSGKRRAQAIARYK